VLAAVDAHLHEAAAAFCESTGMPGLLAGVYHDGEEVVVAHGVANLVTKAAMVEDTGFIIGSITKVLTAMLLLRQVERGVVDLDERVCAYLPEFRLASSPSTACELRLRHLITHSHGIDADLFCPAFKGRDALKLYIEELGRHCGVLFAPGEHVSYSNAGGLVIGRLLEVVTGSSYHELLAREIFGPVGMDDSCTSAEEAILRSTAVGHFRDVSGVERRTDFFMLPDSWSAVGATAICTVRDLLVLGRTHLAGGVSPSGRRVLSQELTRQMQLPTYNVDPVVGVPTGIGWSLEPYGETTVLRHGGSSPGGAAMFIVLPEHDFVFVAFGNDARSLSLFDELTSWLLRDHLGLEPPEVALAIEPVGDLARYEGTYRAHQLRIDVRAREGELEEQMFFEPFDEAQARIWNAFFGGSFAAPPWRLLPIREGLFARAGFRRESLQNIGSRQGLVSFHGDAGGHPIYRSDSRFSRRE
jgi:CubicO group peptidase (beta-lactamase class C family)